MKRTLVRGAAVLNLAVVAVGLACGGLVPATPTPLPFTATTPPTAAVPTATPTPAPPTESPTPAGPCEITADAAVDAYTRPNLSADIFGHMPTGVSIAVLGRTDDGWLGFDPGVAQAANIGVFRLRWVQAVASGITLNGECGSVPVVVGPAVGVCYDMPMEDVPVYQAPDISAAVIATLHFEEYAAVTGVMGLDWARVDLSQGNTSQPGLGWIRSDTLNVNGPCDSLPEVLP